MKTTYYDVYPASEDEEKRAEGEMQRLTDNYVALIDDIVNRKENEVLEV